MNLPRCLSLSLLLGASLAFTGCSSGSDGTSVGTVQSSLQDLTLDPDGTTTVVTFSKAPAGVDASYFSADGGQSALTAVRTANTVTVTWDARVSPSHEITVAGMPGIANGATTPTTSDASVPTFTITDSAMTAGLGGDTLEVTFGGPRVDEADAEDPTSWSLAIGGTPLDLTGSTFDLDVATQVMDITLGPDANLHSAFTLAASSLVSVADTSLSTTPVAGVAAGDSTAPTLVSVEQNLTEDEFGRVIDLTFDEAMDPAFSESAANFSASNSAAPTTIDQPTEGVLRVTFNGPVVPGVDTVTANNMMDAHGNAVVVGVQAVTQPSPVANDFATNDAVTIENVGGDYIESTFDQAFIEASAEDDTNWTLLVDGNPILMSNQTLTYDFLTKTLRIDLDFDMVNGTAFSLTGVGVQEVDGQTFNTAGAGTVGGDVALPTIVNVVQNRTQDPTGYTLDVTFSEDLDATAVGTLTNWTVGALTIDSATLLGTPNVVRVTVSGGAAVPGVYTVDVINQADLAGNVMAASLGLAIISTDSTVPNLSSTTGASLAGADNDTITVWFDDDMVATEIQDPTNWTVESPVGSPLDTTGATVVYNAPTRSAQLTFDAGNDVFFEQGNDYRVSLVNATDISANVISATHLDGSIAFELEHPWADAAWRDGAVNNEVVVRFSEHMNYLDDLYDASTNVDGVRYVVRDSGSVLRGMPSTATVLESGLGVRLSFGFVVNAGDTIDVLGATDLAGNTMYPSLALALPVEDTSEPDWGVQVTPLLAVSGERNDVITLVFDREISPWGAEDYRNYTIDDGGAEIDLSNATFEFDGVDTVTISLSDADSDSLQAAETYDFTVDNIMSVQGVPMSAPSVLVANAVSGDTTTAPVVGASSIRIDRAYPNALLVFADEALDPTTAEDTTRWLYNGASVPTVADLTSPRVVRLTFASNPTAGNNLDFDVVDLAGNASGAGSHVVLTSESNPPILVSVSATAVAGEGGDYVTVVFDEPVETSSALFSGNYSVTNGSNTVEITTSGAWYDSVTQSVSFYLAPGFELDAAQAVNVTVSNVADHSGNLMPTPVALGNVVTGDTTTPPSAQNAFTNFRANEFGLLVDVLFDEAPEESFVTNPFNWNVTGGGGQIVLGVQRLDEDEYRVSLSGALGNGHELEIVTGLPDLAGNVTVAATPVEVAE